MAYVQLSPKPSSTSWASSIGFDSKPLDEAQQEDQDLADIWTYAIIIVIGIIIARIVLQVVKKRMSRST